MPIRPITGNRGGAGPRPHRRRVLAAREIDPALELTDAILRRGDSAETKRAYARDLALYATWCRDEGLAWSDVTGDDLDRFREWLASRYARTTTNRGLVVVRLLYKEAVRRAILADNPAAYLRSLRGRDERGGGALTRDEARAVLWAIVVDSRVTGREALARRDLALVSLLLRTGIRRSEAVGLRWIDLRDSRGQTVAVVRAKGNVMRTVKVPDDVVFLLMQWRQAAADVGLVLGPRDPVFTAIPRSTRPPRRSALTDRAIYDVVARRLTAVGLPAMGPHALRATFVTLALEDGAPLHLVQRAVGHASPETTVSYWRKQDDIDDNAVDYVHLVSFDPDDRVVAEPGDRVHQ